MGSRAKGKTMDDVKNLYMEFIRYGSKENRVKNGFPPDRSAFAKMYGTNRTTLWRWEQSEEFQRETTKPVSDLITNESLAIIVRALEVEAQKGKVPAAKLLFEMSGFIGKMKTQPEYDVDDDDDFFADKSKEEIEAYLASFDERGDRGGGLVAQYTRIEMAEQALERMKCQESFAYFVDSYCMMWTKEGGDPIPFHLWDFQKDACGKFQGNRKLIVLKARQMGMSWLAMAFVVWTILFTKNFHVYITSIGLKEVNEQMERIRFIYYNLPEWLPAGCVLGGKGCKDNDSLMEFTNGSAVHAISSSKSGGHGAAPGLYILDEFSRKENDVMAWRAIKPSLGKNSRVIIISTSNGFNNVYAELWFGAEKQENDFVPVFYSALEHPDYTTEYLADMKADFAGDLQGYKEAFPLTPDEAFMSSSRAVFDTEVISYLKKMAKERENVMEVGLLEDALEGGREFVPTDAGHLLVWKRPQKNHEYTMGVDVAEGLLDGDFSVALVYDVTSNEVVALLRGKFSQETFAYPIEQLARWYNEAYIVLEVNKGADLIMGDLKSNYQQIYHRIQRANIWDIATRVPGFYSSSTSKPRIIMQLRRKLADRTHILRIYSDTVLKELGDYEQDEKNKLGAPRGKHDDCVMALALAIEGTTTLPYRETEADRMFSSQQDERNWRSL